MARRKQPEQGERIHGPYKHKNRWRIMFVRGSGRNRETTYQSFSTKEKALQVKNAVARQLATTEVAVGTAIERYEAYLKEKGNKSRSIATTLFRLRAFFPVEEEPLERITARRAEGLYHELARRVAVDTHRNALAEAKTFLNWCCKPKQRWLSRNPLTGVEGKGRRSEGKEQLRIDEARKWLDEAVEGAEKGEVGAVAAMVSLLMSVRSTPIVTRVVRDLDDGGTLLWVKGKTDAGTRTVRVPPVLQPYLLRLAAGKEPDDLLFGDHCYGWVRQWVKRICNRAGVPEVTAHGMRGAHGTFAEESGETAAAVAKTLGHESPRTTHKHYTKATAVEAAKQRRMLNVLAGGKK